MIAPLFRHLSAPTSLLNSAPLMTSYLEAGNLKSHTIGIPFTLLTCLSDHISLNNKKAFSHVYVKHVHVNKDVVAHS